MRRTVDRIAPARGIPFFSHCNVIGAPQKNGWAGLAAILDPHQGTLARLVRFYIYIYPLPPKFSLKSVSPLGSPPTPRNGPLCFYVWFHIVYFIDLPNSLIMLADMDDLITVTPEQRDEIFARVYVEQKALKNPNAAEIACVRAGISNPELNMTVVASRQLARPEVQKLVMRFEAAGVEVERREYSRDLFLDELQQVAQRALEAKAFPSVISAVKTQAQLLGMLDQTVNINHTVSAKDLDLATLRAMVADRAARDPGMLIEGDFRVVEGGSDEAE